MERRSNRGSRRGTTPKAGRRGGTRGGLSRLKLVGAAAGGTAFLLFGAFAASKVRGYLTTSERFSIRAIEVTGLQRASREEVLRLAGVRIGQNLVAVVPAEVEESVGKHPWVASVEVDRLPPDRLAVTVTEHEPVVLVALGNLYYANAAGEMVKRHAPGERERLPVVTGLEREEIERGDGRAQARLRAAIGFLADLRAVLGDRAPEIEELHLDPVMGLTMVPASPGGGATRVRMGQAPWRGAIARWDRVRSELGARGLAAREITMGGERRPERVVARLASNPRVDAPEAR